MLISHTLKDMLASHNFGENNEMDATLKFPHNIYDVLKNEIVIKLVGIEFYFFVVKT